MNTDNQYIVPTSGNPLRGLIQDHVASAVKLTCKNTFLTRYEFQQLVYISVSGLPGTEIVPYSEDMIANIPPTIYKPKPLWTGKQVITALLAHLIRPPLQKLHLDGKTRTPPTAMGAEQQEHVVIFRFGELLSGVMDKAAIGNSAYGIVHSVYELYGPDMAGLLLTAFGRLFTYYLQDAGHSCGVEDLTLTLKADDERRKLLKKVNYDAAKGIVGYTSGAENISDAVSKRSALVSEAEQALAEERLELMISADRVNEKVKLDATMQSIINKSASDILKACLPNGLERSFSKNNFSMMVMTGAKGSGVNQSQISCFLGQQALEGQRVPVMISGKSLPSFKAYDSSPRAGGFVQDRFLTGVKPQEYYFHCMAGREGLVDTAVKTSRSGYLQRCLVKHLEELKVNYDMTVRDSGNNIVQFLYGEDGLDPVQAAYIGSKSNQMLFLARNQEAFVQRYGIDANFLKNGLEIESATSFHHQVQKIKNVMKEVKEKSNSNVTVLTSVVGLHKGSSVLVRRRKSNNGDWIRENISNNWEMAEIVKVRKSKDSEDGIERLDIRYFSADGGECSTVKKIPLFIAIPSRVSVGGVIEGTSSVNGALKLHLFKADLPKETIMENHCIGMRL